MDKQYYKRTRRTWRRPKSRNTYRFTQNDTNKISSWKTPGHDGINIFWFKKFTSIHSRLAQEMNRCLQGAQVPEWMTKGKTTLIQKEWSKGTAPYLPTNDVEKSNSSNKGKDLQLANNRKDATKDPVAQQNYFT